VYGVRHELIAGILYELGYGGIYRDDYIAVFKGSKTTGEKASWLGTFHRE
jgi:hypothetical protein